MFGMVLGTVTFTPACRSIESVTERRSRFFTSKLTLPRVTFAFAATRTSPGSAPGSM
jgi:hypothetical protein